MKELKIIFIALLSITSCNSNKETNNDYSFSLIPSNKKIEFNIDENTKPETKSLFYYINNKGEECFAFLNDYTNSILFFNIENQKLDYEVKLNKEGPNSTGKICGFKVINDDSILVSRYVKPTLYLVNKKGIIIKTINYDQTTNKSPLICSEGWSLIYTPIVCKSNKLYLTQMPILSDKICIEISMLNDSIKYLPMVHPNLDRQNIENNIFSRDFNDENFIYSFRNEPNIYITKNHKEFYTKLAASDFIDKIKPIGSLRTVSIQEGTIINLETPYYGTIVYDQYRKVYYRFAYPGVKINKNDNFKILWKYLRTFSVIILDRDFKKVGEYLFPNDLYNMKMFFVGKDGLYISTNHLMNPEYDENKLVFELFKLVKQK